MSALRVRFLLCAAMAAAVVVGAYEYGQAPTITLTPEFCWESVRYV